ncbi:sucrose-6F-phosphate phosphohydrolase [Opitutus terrae]|uniref:Sucrose-6F-phosphate phosphohydrolase n=1 Tax=Opitutus terrae (strain DSM 11246 / JCM 15787 / PB90-1) TaxID=452637 RepID=B1ZSI4_OPITP|nr:sucrose-6F-phosphate phosphohydrolase [Opitutus terrae]ACB73841.1 sucrose-6F-phosphate phosphohydrolase [Opitutus terrae PB90-1]
MGKSFSRELLQVPSTFDWASQVNADSLSSFFAEAKGRPLVIVGAGGSFTAAELARLLHERRGAFAVAHTPLSFLESKTDLRGAHVLIFTAGGSNPDVVATYDAAAAREPLGIFVVCARRKSKIELRASRSERTRVLVEPPPTGRDGYLATNSLIGFLALTLRALGHALPDHAAVNRALRISDFPELPQRAGVVNVVVLYGDWGRPAAIDLESKLSEAGLGSVMLADYRHFAHGRHNWINKRGESTYVVALVTPESENIAEKTISLLPRSTRVLRLLSRESGAAAVLPLLLRVFALTAWFGKEVGIDPGRPGIPGYGSRIYHLGPQRERVLSDSNVVSVERKLSARGTLDSAEDHKAVIAAGDTFSRRLEQTEFGAVVTDFDGTMIAPGQSGAANLSVPVATFLTSLLRRKVVLYFATGRGDSIAHILRRSLDKKFHSRILVGYYNGGLTQALSDGVPAPEKADHYPALEALRRELMGDPILARQVEPENKGFQLTVKARGAIDYAAAAAVIREVVASYSAHAMRVVESSHSLDVIPQSSNKLNGVAFVQKQIDPALAVLTFGDRGALGGNDFDLLTHPYSLSVDTVSARLGSCWNLAPAGCRNVAGLLYYARWLTVEQERFTLSIR